MSAYKNAPGESRCTFQIRETEFKETHMSSISPLERLLSRLENVRQHGDGYRADCPNGHRSKSTLSISMTSEGMLLLHCFAGCPKLDILHPIGLELSDLYERPVHRNMTAQQKREMREKARMRQWKAARPDILIEMSVLLSAAGQIYKGFALSKEDMERMLRAGRLLRSALEYL